jgi:hypothetical protein
MVSSGMLRHVALVRTDVSEKRSASVIRVTRIGEIGTATTKNRSAQDLRSSQEKHLWTKRPRPVTGTALLLLYVDGVHTSQKSQSVLHGLLWGQMYFLYVGEVRTQRSGFDSRRYQIF